MSTYIDGRRIQYPKAGQWVREENADADSEKGLIISVHMDGVCHVVWDEGDETLHQPDTLYRHHTGWWWVVPDVNPQVGKTWG